MKKYIFSLVILTGICVGGLFWIRPVEAPVLVLPSTMTQTGDMLSSGALMSTGDTITLPSVSGEEQVEMQKNKMCFVDICIDMDKPVIHEKDGTLVQAYMEKYDNGQYMGREYTNTINKSISYNRLTRINKEKLTASKDEGQEMGSTSETITSMGKYLLRTDTTGGCAGYYHKQSILTLSGTEANIADFVQALPTSFLIGNTNYSLSGAQVEYGDAHVGPPETVLYTGSLSTHDDIGKRIHDFAIANKFLARNYIVEFREIPGVKFLYTSSLTPSDRIIYLGKDTKWLAENLQDEKLLDLPLTKKILGYFDNMGRGVTMKYAQNGYESMLQSGTVLPEQLPIFRLESIDTLGNYLLYTTDSYEIQQFAELCKPLVYIYSQLADEANSLSVTLREGGYFSKLIPRFSHDMTWDFRMNPDGVIDMGTEKFDYLYYSAKVPGYVWNTDGWQVRGSDIEAFFAEKLPKTGMNLREMSDFIGFWKGEFDSQKVYFVSFKFDADIDPYARLSFARVPDAEHRILLEAYPIAQDAQNDRFHWPDVGTRFDRELLHSFTRTGKMDVLEWGGVMFDADVGEYIVK